MKAAMTDNRTMITRLLFSVIPDIPLIQPGDNLSSILIDAISYSQYEPEDMDVFVVAQKIVSKAENRLIDLASVFPSKRARELARATRKDPRIVELILSESKSVIRYREGILITEHRLGYIMANAGVDRSNVAVEDGSEWALLLPKDPDESARVLREQLETYYERKLGIVISDSVGRPWRMGSIGMALGSAGIPALLDYRGKPDLFGRTMEVTEVAQADQIAAGAALVMGETGQGCPVALVRGIEWHAADSTARQLIRPPEQDLFRS